MIGPAQSQARAAIGAAGEGPRPGDVGTLRLADGTYAGHAHGDGLEEVLASADGAVGEILEVAVAARVVHQTTRVGVHVIEPEQHEATLGIDDRGLVELADGRDDTAADADIASGRLPGGGVDDPAAADHDVRFDKRAHVREIET